MSNPNFMPTHSTNEIYRNLDDNRCLTDDLDAIEQDLTELQENQTDPTQFAPVNHNHDGTYSPVSHNHNGTYAEASHNHTNKADLVNGVIPVSQLPSEAKEMRLAANIAARNAMTGLFEGLHVTVLDATADSTVSSGGATYVYDGQNWIKVSETESMDLVLQWANILNKPTAMPADGGNADTVDGKHASDFISSALQAVNDTGGVQYSYGSNSGKNILTEITSWSKGFHTAYVIVGTDGNPNTTESFRIFAYKSDATIGWILAFGSSGSIYSNYQNTASTFRGWRKIYDVNPGALWSGSQLMTDSQTVTPSKKLSECKNGWMLEWCDYDSTGSTSGTTNNYNIVHSPIFKKRGGSNNWAGENMMFDVPCYCSADGQTRTIAIKQLNVYDNKLVGCVANDQSSENLDVVLRAVYEF